jgi:hypothetical protein
VIEVQFRSIKKKRFNYAAVKASALAYTLIFCHFLALMQESNQRKSRKNNASARKNQRAPRYSFGLTRMVFLFDDFRTRNTLLHSRFILNKQSVYGFITREGISAPGETGYIIFYCSPQNQSLSNF